VNAPPSRTCPRCQAPINGAARFCGQCGLTLDLATVPRDPGTSIAKVPEPAHDDTPERIFKRRWALSVLDRVVERLRSEFIQHGRPEHFDRLKVFLLGQSDAPYASLAREMNTSEGALKVAIHRLRKRYRELFRKEIADTVIDPADVESELRHLAAVLATK